MPAEIEARNYPVLVSANSLFDHRRQAFREVPLNLMDLDAALDSAGFVAMARYKRYPWSVAQYVRMAVASGFTWWSQMDACCEPQVAGDQELVRGRVHATARMLAMCRAAYFATLEENPELAPFCTPPMPILQGWTPDNYRESAELADQVLAGAWPDMIGIGSVCRRNLNGPDGLWRILHDLDGVLPKGVRLHLFGVKGAALAGLNAHPRVVSVDSMAFEFAARMNVMKSGAKGERASKTVNVRMAALDDWMARQGQHATQQAQGCLHLF